MNISSILANEYNLMLWKYNLGLLLSCDKVTIIYAMT